MDFTWETISDPVVMGALIAILMQVFGKKFARWLAGIVQADPDKKEMVKGIVINAVTILLGLALVSIRFRDTWALEPIAIMTAQAVAAAIGEYEALKNLLKLFGWKWH